MGLNSNHFASKKKKESRKSNWIRNIDVIEKIPTELRTYSFMKSVKIESPRCTYAHNFRTPIKNIDVFFCPVLSGLGS